MLDGDFVMERIEFEDQHIVFEVRAEGAEVVLLVDTPSEKVELLMSKAGAWELIGALMRAGEQVSHNIIYGGK